MVESMWNERQQFMAKVYAQLMKPDEVLTKLINTLKLGLDTSEDGEPVGSPGCVVATPATRMEETGAG